MAVSLIIPAYNEAKRLGPFLDSLAQLTKTQPNLLHEIMVVDDGSRDATAQIAEEHKIRLPILKVLKQPANQGKGAAVKIGVMAAQGDIIIFMDADGATDANQIPRMLEVFQTQNPDIVIGNRFLPGAKTERHSPLRQFSGFVNRMYMRLFGLGHIDVMCGFKGYKKDIARTLFQNLMETRWLFDTEIAYKAMKAKYRIINIPIAWESKDGSKLPTRTLIKSAFQIWPLIHRINKQAS
ncbi:MAG: glycosyltransferase family 2 protein [Candidatus Andersenbacteria bacterium]|nr:glycosyltransferase family 2 protein [Candidatus Andersenbacteria bacterium]